MDDPDFGQLIEPAPVPFTFDAPGWYVLVVIILLLLLAIVWIIIRKYRRNKYRRTALAYLQQIEKNNIEDNDYAKLVYETNMLLKRIAMAKYGRTTTAAIRGNEWIDYINSKWRKNMFNNEDVGLLNNTIYESEVPSPEVTLSFVNKSKKWIKSHG